MSKMHCRTTARRKVQLAARDGGDHCFYCGVAFDASIAKRAPTIDHVVPERLGGHRTALENLVLACARCNVKKQGMTVDEFLVSRFLQLRRARVLREQSAELRRTLLPELEAEGLSFVIEFGADDAGRGIAIVRDELDLSGWALLSTRRKAPHEDRTEPFQHIGGKWASPVHRGWSVSRLVAPTGDTFVLRRRRLLQAAEANTSDNESRVA